MMRSTIGLTLALALCAGVTGWTQQPSSSTGAEILRQAQRLTYQARDLQVDAAPKVLALLQEATKQEPDNGSLWSALAGAYILQVATGQAGPFAAALPTFQRSLDASERALQLNPNDALALTSHGVVLTTLASLQQKPEWFPQGIAEMNRAVELSPFLTAARLNRAFGSLGYPAQLRNTQMLTEDLEFLITVSEGKRAGDMLHLVLGDLYGELGRTDDARRHYATAARPASAAAEQAQGRLVALEHGAVPAEDVRRLRGGVGVNCVMCHAK